MPEWGKSIWSGSMEIVLPSQRSRGKPASMPVTGDHSILQNIELFHGKSMETRSQRPGTVTFSQRRPTSLWHWWPVMSRQIIFPAPREKSKTEEERSAGDISIEVWKATLLTSCDNPSQAWTKYMGCLSQGFYYCSETPWPKSKLGWQGLIQPTLPHCFFIIEGS